MRIKQITFYDETNEYVFIDHEDGSYTSMLKSIYDEMIAAQSTPIVTEDE